MRAIHVHVRMRMSGQGFWRAILEGYMYGLIYAHGTGLIARKEVRRPVAPVAGEEELLVYVQHHGRRKEGRKTGPLQ